MMRNWMIAAACFVAWGGVVGCSGNNAAAPPDPTVPGPTDPVDPAPTDPTDPTDPEPDAGEDFDEAHGKAKMDLDAAVEDVESATRDAAAAATAAERSAAREALSAAEMKLEAAVRAARGLPQPADGDEVRIAQRAALVASAEAAQTEQREPIMKAQAQVSPRWSERPSFARAAVPAAPTLPEVHAVRTLRTNAARNAHSPDLLWARDISTYKQAFPPVQYEPGYVLISEGEVSTEDKELRMQGFAPVVVRDDTRRISGSNLLFDTNRGNDRFVAGLRITPAGLVIRMGGLTAEGSDFRINVGNQSVGPTNFPADYYYAPNPLDTDPDIAGWDLTLTFGEPTVSPEGSGENYWAARLMPDPSQIAAGADAATRARLLVDGRPSPVGTYVLRLSNHVGVETNLEPAEGSSAGAFPDDDDNFFLSYAAYGLMTFEASDQFPYVWNRYDRAHAFHLGYDAFKNEEGQRTIDIEEAVSSKFTGYTMALELVGIDRGNTTSGTSLDLRAAKQLRGEVELTATISGTASNNRIAGKISNLDVWDSNGYWKPYASVTGDIALGSATIGADGYYGGNITGVAGFGNSHYIGAFYGPTTDLETAGSWYLQGTNQGAGALRKAVVGSFGAKLEQP